MNKEQELLRGKSPVNIRNKKASFEYFFVDNFTAGIVLTGTEIKSIRMGKASLVDTFCYINNGEIWVKGMNISPYFPYSTVFLFMISLPQPFIIFKHIITHPPSDIL